jgi:erythronate-4-phosphate dehydrogenase
MNHINITADENIPYVKDAFKSLGTVTTLKGRDISNNDLTQTDILLVRSVTQVNEALLAGTPVKFVASATAGFNHIELEYLNKHTIGFARAPGSNAISAAEYVLAGICKWSLSQNQSFQDLQTLTIGIIGYGNVGSRVKRLCDDFGIQAVINDPPLQLLQQLSQAPQDQQGITFSSLDEALACDIVTLHTPLTHDGAHPTLRLINQKHIATLKPGTLFINAARGEVIEEPALLKRMQEKNDLSLILDVWENEPAISLEMLEQTLIGTPHIAGYSIDGKIRGTEMIYQAVCNFLGEKTQWNADYVAFPDHPKYKLTASKQLDKRKAILEAYDIMADDARLKKMLNDESLSDGKYFDHLRKSYPVRREFSAPSVLFPKNG